MTIKKIHKQQVFDAARKIVSAGYYPTLTRTREYLGTGSKTTIHKHLKQWKEECFKKNILNVELDAANCDFSKLEISETYLSLEKQRNLENALGKQVSKNEYYAQELINAEKANVDLKEENNQLQNTVQKLQLNLAEIKVAKNYLEQINKEIQTKLDISINSTIQKMQQTIDDLRVELKTLNETYINALRETSTQGHEALMQEKVNSINLQTKIDNLTKELLDSKKKAYEALITAQVQNRSLSRQNEQLQKILQENGLDKLWSAEGSSLAFTNGAAVDGK